MSEYPIEGILKIQVTKAPGLDKPAKPGEWKFSTHSKEGAISSVTDGVKYYLSEKLK